MILSKTRITKAMISLCGCAGWSAPLLFANRQRQVFSRRIPYEKPKISLLRVKYMRKLAITGIQFCVVMQYCVPGRVAQSVTCLATDACLTADPGVASSIPVRSHTFVEIDHEMISTVILLPSADSFKNGCCQLQAKVCARITG